MLNNLYQKYKDRGLTVLGIPITEDAEKSCASIKRHNITYPQLLNTMSQYEAYGIKGIPYAILFTPDGKIIVHGTIYTVCYMFSNDKDEVAASSSFSGWRTSVTKKLLPSDGHRTT